MTNQALPTIEKRCPDCGNALLIRTNRKTGTDFISCSSWPECSHTESIPETLRMRLAGAPELPMFDDETPAPVTVPLIDHRPIERCRSCGAAIVWGKTAKGKPCPFDVVGMRVTDVSHFTTCPQAKQWSRQR